MKFEYNHKTTEKTIFIKGMFLDNYLRRKKQVNLYDKRVKGGIGVKKVITLVFVVFALFVSFAGCDTTLPLDNKETFATEPSVESVPSAPERQNIIKAWVGDGNEETIKNTILEYQAHGEPFAPEENDLTTCITYDTGFEVAWCSVIRLSKVDDTDMNIELTGYIDLSVKTESNGTQIKIYTGCISGSGIQKNPLWSYLVRVTAVDGTIHYYYFRVDYKNVITETNG